MGRLDLGMPRGPDGTPKPPSRAAYALPTLFTAGNVFLGYLAITRSVQGALLGLSDGLGPNPHFEVAAKAIGVAVFLDGLDGRIARMTNTTSDFGREMDSLADVISFGVAPAVLSFVWGVQFVNGSLPPFLSGHLRSAAYFICFLFLLCGSVRLARFKTSAAYIIAALVLSYINAGAPSLGIFGVMLAVPHRKPDHKPQARLDHDCERNQG